jgi:hypothetical protein
MKCLIPVLAAALVASLPVPARFCGVHAQERMEAWPSGGVTPQRISMGVGKSRIVDLLQDAAEIFVANPRVANAVVRSPRKLYIIGMDAGQTSVYALDQQGRQIAALELSIGRDVGELQQSPRDSCSGSMAEGLRARRGERGWLGRQYAHHTWPRSGDVEGHRRGNQPRYRQATRHHHKLADRQLGHVHPI